MLNVLSQPKPQNAEAAIITIADRLDHSTMLEDRRAAALSLKALSHTNRELVASVALRGLISSLETDKEDRETRRALLETLIILFIKSSTQEFDHAEQVRKTRRKNKWYMSPLALARAKQTNELQTQAAAIQSHSQIDNISLWLTDEFIQSESAMPNLVEFVTSSDTFTSLYALQLLSAIFSFRPERARQAMLAISIGVSTLVSALKSDNDMLAEEAVLLLICLTDSSPDLQKLVAFEGAFDAVFDICDQNGGVVYGGASVENCLELLTNLLTYNVSNQRLFVETQCITRYANLLEVSDEDMSQWSEQAITNLQSTLHIARLFMFPGADRTLPNQNAFARGKVMLLALRLAFAPQTPLHLRTSALLATASIVHNNPEQQTDLTQIDVPYYDMSISMRIQKQPLVLPVLQVLLNWALVPATIQCFDLRVASYTLLCSVFENNLELKTLFLNTQIDMHREEEKQDANPNLIDTIVEFDEQGLSNPYKLWFACAILSNLFASHEIKDELRKLQIGDAELGQDVISIVHAVSAQLVASLPSRETIAPISYLMLLIVWLYDDFAAVDDFLEDRSVINALLNFISSNQWGTASAAAGSLATILLGVACDFSRECSPVPRKEMYQQLRNSIGKDQFMFHVQMFREMRAFKDFESLPLIGAPVGENGLPMVLFEPAFVALVSENINRIQRAIDHDPDSEPSARITWEMYDQVKTEADQLKKQLVQHKHDRDTEQKDLETSFQALSAKHDATAQELKSLEISKVEEDIKLRQLEAEAVKLREENKILKADLSKQQELAQSSSISSATNSEELQKAKAGLVKLQTELQQERDARKKAEDGINKMSRELMVLTKQQQESTTEVSKYKAEVAKISKELEKQLSARTKFHERLQVLELELNNEREAHSAQNRANSKLIKKLEETAHLIAEKNKEDEELEQVLANLDAATAENQQLVLRCNILEKELRLVKQRLDVRKNGDSDDSKDKEIAGLKTKLAGMQNDLTALDELIVLLDDLTMKKSKYKQQVAQSGGTVSDSEDDS